MKFFWGGCLPTTKSYSCKLDFWFKLSHNTYCLISLAHTLYNMYLDWGEPYTTCLQALWERGLLCVRASGHNQSYGERIVLHTTKRATYQDLKWNTGTDCLLCVSLLGGVQTVCWF